MNGSIFKHDRILRDFSIVYMGSLKDHTGIISVLNCNQISIMKGSHQDLDTITEG